jgi:hypothetical protein
VLPELEPELPVPLPGVEVEPPVLPLEVPPVDELPPVLPLEDVPPVDELPPVLDPLFELKCASHSARDT